MSSLCTRILAIALFLSQSQYASAQLPDYHVQVFDERFGIRSWGLQKITMDKKDFIWLMYSNRIQRFDGKQVKEYFLGEGNRFIFCDSNNGIWLSSSKGVYKFENDRKGFQPVAVDTTGRPHPGNIFQFPGKTVWLLTNRGVYEYDSQKKKFKPLEKPSVEIVSPASTGRLSSSCYRNTIFYNAGNKIFAAVRGAPPKPGLSVSDLYGLFALNDHIAVVSSWNGESFFYDFAVGKIQPIGVSRYLANNNFLLIRDVLNLNDHLHLLSTNRGLIEYNSRTGQVSLKKLFFKGQPLFGQEQLQDLYFDKQNRVWACGYHSLVSFNPFQQGIGLIRNQENDPAKAFRNDVRNFAADEKDNLWLATNGIAYFDIQKGTIEPYHPVESATDRINHPSVRGIAYDGKYVIIGQTDKGVWLYDPRARKYRRPYYEREARGDSVRKKIDNDFIDQIYTLHNGHHIIVARDRGYFMNGKTYIIKVLDFIGNNENLNFCYEDNQKQIWVGTQRKLYCLDSNFTVKLAVKEGLGSGIMRSLIQWSDDEYIVGTQGLYQLRVTNGKAQTSKVHPFFDNIYVHLIYKDTAGKLWLGTDEGLYRYHREDNRIEKFDEFDNIQGDYYHSNSFYRSRNGLLFMGGVNGINYFYPEKINTSGETLQVSVMKMAVNGDDSSYSGNKDIRLRYFQNSVEFDFVAPYFRNANRVQYRYQLAGLDEDWVENGNSNTVRFTSLPAGNYSFRVAASVNGTNWFESKENFSFTISPPFWKTWWFLLFAAALMAAIVYWIYRYQLNKKLELERLRLRISRDLHDDIGSALTSISVLSKVALSKGGNITEMGTYLSKIKNSTAQTMESMSDIVWAINPENDKLEAVISRMKEFAAEMCEAKQVDLDFIAPKESERIYFDLAKRKNIFLICKEAVNNAIKYSDCTRLHVGLEKEGNLLRLVIRDNGKGFDENSVRKGNGLKSMKERAAQAGGNLTIQSNGREGVSIQLEIPITRFGG